MINSLNVINNEEDDIEISEVVSDTESAVTKVIFKIILAYCFCF